MIQIPLLDKDIRKLPEPVKKRSRKMLNTTSGSQTHGSPQHTSHSNTSYDGYDGQSSPLASRQGESSVTSTQEYADPPSLQAFRKKPRKSNMDQHAANAESERQRYWNEYDNPEDEEAGYYIYIDPNAIVKFPGQELIEACANTARRILGMRSKADLDSLSVADDASTDDDDDTVDEFPITAAANYGTITSHDQAQSQEGYFSTLFNALRNPRHDADILYERRSLLNELETRRHNTEMAKLRFYSICLISAIFIDVILGIMTVTSRKKERGVVDGVVLFGTIVTLTLCIVAVLSMRTRKERLGWVHQGAVLCLTGGVVGLDVLLLLWILRV